MRAVECRGLRFRYRGAEEEALAGVDFHAEEGERVAVIGLTGAGKSTLLKCLNRLVPASNKGDFAGQVSLFGQDLAGRRPAELIETVALLFQDFESQLFSTTAERDAAFGPENLGLSHPEIQRRVAAALAAVGLADFARRDPTTLSGGQKQRLALASILALQPRVLALDEPSTDLDPQGRQEISRLIRELSSRQRTVIIAEHEPELAATADRIVGLRRGEKICDQETVAALRDPALLEGLGVRAPDPARLFHRLGLAERPGSAGEAVALLAARGVRVRPETAAEWRARDERGRERLGAETVRFDNLSYSYPGAGGRALCGVSAGVRAGEMVAVLGHNGSGKTTLVKHLIGLLKPAGGAVTVAGRDTRSAPAAELGRTVGFVFQDPDHQIFEARVEAEVAFGPRNFGLSAAEIKQRVTEALEQVGLGSYRDRDPFLLTKGERQRVALASALAARPEIIALDEPTTGLDYPAQRAVMDLLAELARAGRAVIFVTHALWAAAEYAGRCIVMAGGKVAGDGPARAVLSDAGLLARAGLTMPAVTAIGLGLGGPALTVPELAGAIGRETP